MTKERDKPVTDRSGVNGLAGFAVLSWLGLTRWSALTAGLGAMLTISVLAALEESGMRLLTQDQIWLMAPFGATMVLLFGLPDSPLAQPKNIVVGHIMTTAIGLAVMGLFGVHAWSLGLAVGLAIIFMMVTKTVHPPAGANPLLVMLTGQSVGFLVSPVAIGAVIIVLLGWFYHKVLCQREYPKQWF